MAHRMDTRTRRGKTISIDLDGQPLACFEGETIATVLLAHDILTFRQDDQGAPRGPVCNMGVCYECMVEIGQPDGQFARRRACMTLARDTMVIRLHHEEKAP